MFHSIRLKLISVISLMIVILMTILSIYLIRAKSKELTYDMYTNSISYAELSSGEIVDAYNTYFLENGFVQFHRILHDLLSQTSDISSITFVKYDGTIIYDSATDVYTAYEGVPRTINSSDSRYLRIQAPFPSVNVIGSQERVMYLEKTQNNVNFEVDLDGRKVQPLAQGERIGEVIYPLNGEYAIIYKISYDQLERRIAQSLPAIGLLICIGTFIGVVISFAIGTKISAPVTELRDGALQIAGGNFDFQVQVRSKDEIGVLSETFNKMAIDLKSSMQAKLYKERVVKELEIAKNIQNSLIPKNLPNIEGLDVYASVHPAEEIGGDCYDFIPVTETRTIMYLGDVTGHGVPSGLLVSVANALISSYAETESILDILVKTNRIMKMKSQPNMFVTMVMMDWDSASRKLNYISAGHEKILHFSSKSNSVIEQPSGGIALGMIPDCSKMLSVKSIDVQRGDYLIVYSDGIPEAWSEKGEVYGMQRLRKILFEKVTHADTELSASDVHDAIISDVKSYMGVAKQMDDITLLVLKVT